MPRTRPVTYINVGANKGYRVPEFLGLWSQRRVPGYTRGWQRRLLQYAEERKSGSLKAFSCGGCSECRAKPPI